MMRIDLILKRWIDILAELLLVMLDRRRARRCLKVVQEHDRFVFRRLKGRDEVDLGTVSAGAELPTEIVREAQRSFVVLELPDEEIIRRHMSVPAQARDLLPGIVLNQIERLSAWRPSQAAHGFEIRPGADAASLDVSISITSRAMLDDSCRRL